LPGIAILEIFTGKEYNLHPVSPQVSQNRITRQPWRGLCVFIVSLSIALGIAAVWDPVTLQELPFGLILCMVPVFVVMGSFWKDWPFEKYDQPVRGLLLFLLSGIFAGIIFTWTRLLIGRGELSPVTNMFGITVVTLMVVMGPLFSFSLFAGRMSKLPAGICWLALVYILGYLLFRLLYHFGPLADQPWYNPAIDPGGRFFAVYPLSIVVMGLPFAFAFLHLEMWPFSGLKQPWLGLVSCSLVWSLAALMYFLATSVMGFPALEAQVRFGVYGVFGMMICQMMFEGWPGRGLPQPFGGLLKIIPGIVLSIGMFYLVRAFGCWVFPGSSAMQGDALYNWMATVALGLCFPFFALYTSMFQSWPFLPHSSAGLPRSL